MVKLTNEKDNVDIALESLYESKKPLLSKHKRVINNITGDKTVRKIVNDLLHNQKQTKAECKKALASWNVMDNNLNESLKNSLIQTIKGMDFDIELSVLAELKLRPKNDDEVKLDGND